MERSSSPSGRVPVLRARCVAFRALALVAVAVPAPRQMIAQETRLSLDLGASYSLPPGGSEDFASTYLNGGLRLGGTFGPGGFFDAGLTGGLALDDQGASWGSARIVGGWFEPVSPVWMIGVTATGEAFAVGDPAPYRAAYAVAEPEIRFSPGNTTLRLTGYAGIGTSEVTVIETFVRDTRFGRRVWEVGYAVGTDLWSVGGGLEVMQAFGAFVPHLAVEAYDSPQGGYAVGRLGFEISLAGGAFFGEASWWDTPEGEEPVFVAGVQVRTGKRTRLYASGGRYGPDPLLDTVVAGGVGAGTSLELWRLRPASEFSWTVSGAGDLRLALSVRLSDAGAVEVTGDFTEWERVPLVRSGDTWTTVLPIAEGVYHFGFFVDGEWYVPAEAPGLTEDDWGMTQATLVIQDPRSGDVTP